MEAPASAPADDEPVAAPRDELAARLQELMRQAEQQAQQLELEGRTRAELEDVLQRIERHFRGEQAVRRRAEDAEREATQEMEHEREMRVRLEEELRLRGAETRETDALRASLEAEHAAVEEDCKRVEQELGVARSEAKKALATLAKAEEAVRQSEAMERLKIEAEHNARMNRLMAELQRVQEELDVRTRVVGAEMVRWRAQAEAAAAAVRDAKEELMDRKRELDVTKERMDGLVEKLYVGREKGLELRGAIDSHLERFGHPHAQALAVPLVSVPLETAAPPAVALGTALAAEMQQVQDAAVAQPPAASPEPASTPADPPRDPPVVPPSPPPGAEAPSPPPPQQLAATAKARKPASASSGTAPRGYAELSRAASKVGKPKTPNAG